jgi:16S rRNA processing protein RimM
MLPGLEAAELPADAIEVGRIADAWGIKGWFKVLPYSADPEALFSSKLWFLLPSDRGAKAFLGAAKLSLREIKNHSDSVVANAVGVDDRNIAETLRGCRIFIARSTFPAAARDEYYWVDLIGLAVVNREGIPLGVVRELLSTGPQTVLVIEYSEDDKQQERMIPFVSVYIDDVNIDERLIRVDWQADY